MLVSNNYFWPLYCRYVAERHYWERKWADPTSDHCRCACQDLVQDVLSRRFFYADSGWDATQGGREENGLKLSTKKLGADKKSYCVVFLGDYIAPNSIVDNSRPPNHKTFSINHHRSLSPTNSTRPFQRNRGIQRNLATLGAHVTLAFRTTITIMSCRARGGSILCNGVPRDLRRTFSTWTPSHLGTLNVVTTWD